MVSHATHLDQVLRVNAVDEQMYKYAKLIVWNELFLGDVVQKLLKH